MLTQVAATTWGPSGILGFFVMTAGPNSPLKTMLFYGIGLFISCVMGGLITWFTIKESDLGTKSSDVSEPESIDAVPEHRRVTHGETVLRVVTADENSYVIRDDAGIHARPAGALVELVKQFDAQVYLTANGRTARADSILEIMSLGAGKGTKVSLRAEGPRANEALHAVRKFMAETL